MELRIQRDSAGRITALTDANGTVVKRVIRDDAGKLMGVDIQEPEPSTSVTPPRWRRR